MSDLDLKLLGGAALEGEEGPVTGPASRRFPLALLALLASAPSRELARSKVVGLLWPDSPERDGRNRLNTYVHQVRSELGDEVLVSVGDRLRLNAGALDCDVWRFEGALEAEDPRRAVELYAGPFLDGFALGGSASFEKRVDRTRDRLRRAHLEALETLAEEAGSRGAPEEAATWWRRRSEEDPYDSRVVRRLMEALAAADNRPAALRAAREHARRLEEEIGTGPGEGIRELAARLKEGEAGEAAPGPPAAGAGSAEAPEDAPPSGGDLSPRTVAVLPFESLGEGEGAETFAAGLHDDLITELSRAPGLAVISRTSVARYGGGDGTAAEVGRELGAGTLVQGAVRAAGDRVRLNVQLVDARADAHRWAESFDRRLTPEGLFEIQGELASRIAGSLHAELTPEGEEEGEERSGRAPTGDLEAYRLCVQGRALLDQRTGDDLRQAADYFRRTLERDPEHPLAWSGLAEALALLDFYGHPVPGDAPDALDAAERGVEADPGSGEARTARGIVRSLRLDGPGALDDLERARELAPSHAEAHVWLGWVRLVRGEAERALPPLRRSVELNPLGPALRVYLAEALLAAGSPEEGLRQARRAGELQPGYALAAFLEGLVLHHMDRHREAADRLEKALALTRPRGTPSRPEARAALAATRAAAGQEERARELLARIEEDREGRARAFSAALARAALGDAEGAFDALGRVDRWDEFSVDHARYFFPRALGRLRGDPRWERALAEADRAWGWTRAEASG